jgi:hypothetical protein
MKKFLSILTAAVALNASALAYDSTPFAASGVGNGTAFCYAIIPASDYQKVQVQYINATSDKVGSVLTFLASTSYGGEGTVITGTGAGANTIICPAPAGLLTSGSEVVIQGSSAQRMVVSGTGTVSIVTTSTTVGEAIITGTTVEPTITFTGTLSSPVNAGDKVYLMSPQGTVPVGVSTISIQAPTIFATAGGPALIELTGSTNCSINLLGGTH